MRTIQLLLALPLLTLLAGVPAADAAPKNTKGAAAKEDTLPKIEATGIAEFDDVFMKAKAIHDTLDVEDKKLKDARKALATTLGVAEDFDLAASLGELKNKANGKIKAVMNGKTPRLAPSDAVPEDVQAGIDAVNKLLDATESVMDKGAELYPQSKELAAAAAGFPAKLPTMGLDPMKMMEASKKVGNNVKATGATPDRVDRLVKTSEGVFTDVKGTFAE